MEDNVFSSIESEKVKLPLPILEDYANLFNESFKQKLAFELKTKMEDSSDLWASIDLSTVKKEQEEKKQVTRAYVLAPELNNYRLLILRLSYKISEVYPCTLENVLEDMITQCDDANSLNVALLKLFQSETFQRPIRMILAQLIQQ